MYYVLMFNSFDYIKIKYTKKNCTIRGVRLIVFLSLIYTIETYLTNLKVHGKIILDITKQLWSCIIIINLRFTLISIFI